MPHRSVHRIVRLAASALCSLALVTVMLAPYPAPRAFAEEPPADGGTSTAAPAPTGEADGGSDGTDGASSGDTGATSGSTTSGSGGTTSTGGDGTSTGGGSGSGSTATTTGGDAGATGGTGSTSDSGSAMSGNAADTGTGGGTTTPPEGAVTTSNSTQQGTGGDTATAGTTSTTDGTSGAAAAPSTTSASTGSGAANSATASSGAATAIGNLSTTDIVQMVIAIVNIVMPNVDPSQFTMPLVSITQNATVTNIGNAVANTGNNSAVVSVLSSIAQQAGMTTTQLAGIVSAQASTASGSATAVGNVTWSDISQLASVIVSVNGDASYTSQLTSVTQNAQVSNQGSASANTGGNTSSVTVQTQNSANGGGSTTTVTQTDVVSPPMEDVPDDGTNSDKPVLYWGPASGPTTLVWVYVHGKLCKAADTIQDPDFRGRFIWEAKLAPRECNVYRGAKVNFIVVNPAQQTVVWDNLLRESPEIRLITPEGVLGSAAVKTR
ncbi:MAG: hypothetical protein WC211_09455 [Dehalococcoidia bacterium]